MSKKVRQEWERLDSESSRAYAAFCAYRDLGLSRSIVKALKASGKSAANLRQWEHWSSKHQWVDRAVAFDDQCEQNRLAQREAARREMDDRHAKIGLMGLNLAVQAIQKLLASVQAGEKNLTATDLARLLDISAKLERLGRGVSTDIHRGAGTQVGQIQIKQNEYILAVRTALGFIDGPAEALVSRQVESLPHGLPTVDKA